MPANSYGWRVGDHAFVGPFVEIQRGVQIGNRTRIHSHSFVCELVTIGEDCVVAHGVMFINDTYASGRPAGGDRTQWRPTRIGDRVYIGSNAHILPVAICRGVGVGAGGVGTPDILGARPYVCKPAGTHT